MSTPRVFITGIGGFTGAALARFLHARGMAIYGLSNSPVADDVAALCENITIGSIVDEEVVNAAMATARPQYVIHLAGISFTNYANATPYYEVNVVGSEAVLKAARTHGDALRKVILASSAAVYGTPTVDAVDERTVIAPTGHYGLSKRTMELMAQNYMADMPILMTRPFNYTGPGQPDYFLVPKIVKHFAQSQSAIELGNIHVVREFSDLRDAVENYAALMDCNATGVVNLCTGQAVSVADVIDTLRDLSDHDLNVTINPEFVRPTDIPRLVGNPTLLQKLTGRTAAFDLRATLADMLKTAA